MANIVLHQLEISPFCDKVRRVLHIKGCEYEIRNVPLAGLGRLKRLSPVGKVPVLELDGRVIADSSDICRELDRLYPDPPVFPADPAACALVDILEDWADESLYFFEMTIRFVWPDDRARWVDEILKYDNALMRRLGRPLVAYLTRTQSAQQGISRRSMPDILRELRRHIASIDELVSASGGYLVGGCLSLADIAVLSQIECIAGSVHGLAAVREKPQVVAWMERVEAATGGPANR
jgi:glutathione S-transferase